MSGFGKGWGEWNAVDVMLVNSYLRVRVYGLRKVGATGYHCVAVYDWRKTALLFSAQASQQPVLDCTWTGIGTFVTVGVNHCHFWSQDGPRAYRRQRGLFGKKAQPQPLLCAKAFGSVLLTGCSSGHLAIWEGRNCIRSIKAHSGAVTALHVLGAR